METVLPKKIGLIYYIHSVDLDQAKREAEWLIKLSDDVGPRTTLSFDHLVKFELHPLWELLRLSPDESATALLPILDAGCVEMGRGLWPVLPLETIDSCLKRMYRHHFLGAIVQVCALPATKGLLECNLWIASALLWKEISSELAAETWFKAYRSDLDFAKNSATFKLVEQLTFAIKKLGSDHSQTKAKAQLIISQLNYLKHLENSGLTDYLLYFDRDIRRLLVHSLQEQNLSIPNMMEGVDGQESFWTRIAVNSNSMIRGSARVEVLESPLVNTQEAGMVRILQESRFI